MRSRRRLRQMLKWMGLGVLLLLFMSGCMAQLTQSNSFSALTEAKRGFKTVVVPATATLEPVAQAPEAIFQTVKYPSSVGKLAAYLSPNPGDGQTHPAIIWITGGDSNSIGNVWSPAPRNNDQTAAAYRKAGIIMMFPSLRGGNDNPGVKEGFLGEVDDVLAAADYLSQQPYVDPQRIYLGGHSTGGTLALLVAQSSKRFRAVFSFGPVEAVSSYGQDSGLLPFDLANPEEVKVRSPIYWLESIQSPTWVFEGTDGNIDSLRAMAKQSTNPQIQWVELSGMDHFNMLAPVNEIIAQKIMQDTGKESNLAFSSTAIEQALKHSTRPQK
jgi:alpha/beta superfamily hydrolase